MRKLPSASSAGSTNTNESVVPPATMRASVAALRQAGVSGAKKNKASSTNATASDAKKTKSLASSTNAAESVVSLAQMNSAGSLSEILTRLRVSPTAHTQSQLTGRLSFYDRKPYLPSMRRDCSIDMNPYPPMINTKAKCTTVAFVMLNEKYEPHLDCGLMAEEKSKNKTIRAEILAGYVHSNATVPIYVRPNGDGLPAEQSWFYLLGHARILGYVFREEGIQWAPNPEHNSRGSYLVRNHIFQFELVEPTTQG